jgi:diguanylate cyclase (GGDEF)-like protein/PAS domain S-box-containing protein
MDQNTGRMIKSRQIIQNTRDTIFWINKNGVFEFVSPSWELNLGHKPSQVEGKSFKNFIHPDDLDLCNQAFIKIINSEFSLFEGFQPDSKNITEYRILHLDGSWRWHSSNAVPIFDDAKKVIGIQGTSRDITELKNAKLELEQTRLNYDTFFNRINEFLFVAEPNGKILHFNKTVTDRLHYTSEELLGKQISMVYPKNRYDEVLEIMNKISLNEVDFCSIPFQAKSGELIYVETRATHGFWDGKPVLFGVSKDISELTFSEEKFSKIFMLNPIACSLTDFETNKYVEVNDAFYKLFGYSKEEVIGKTPLELNTVSTKAWKNLVQIIKTEDKIANLQVEIITKNGDKKYSVCSTESIFVQGIKYRYSVINDVTNRIENENKILYLSYHDQLTGLFNRRYFVDTFEKMKKLESFPIGIMILDVNGLKIINDAYGHDMGDKALKAVSVILKETFKTKNIVCRMGGDEFTVIIPNTTIEEMQELKETLKTKMIKKPISKVVLTLAVGYDLLKDANKSLDEIQKTAEKQMYRHKLAEGVGVRNRAIKAILNTLTEKYKPEKLHCELVSVYCREIGVALLLNSDDIKDLTMAGMFHDIGKISIPDSILEKSNKLKPKEYAIMKNHTFSGYQILRAADEYSDLAIYALSHHEHWDGNGYPKGLKGTEIPLYSRIIPIADAFQAMTSERSNKKPISVEKAKKELLLHSGTQFDPEILKVFIEKVADKL